MQMLRIFTHITFAFQSCKMKLFPWVTPCEQNKTLLPTDKIFNRCNTLTMHMTIHTDGNHLLCREEHSFLQDCMTCYTQECETSSQNCKNISVCIKSNMYNKQNTTMQVQLSKIENGLYLLNCMTGTSLEVPNSYILRYLSYKIITFLITQKNLKLRNAYPCNEKRQIFFTSATSLKGLAVV